MVLFFNKKMTISDRCVKRMLLCSLLIVSYLSPLFIACTGFEQKSGINNMMNGKKLIQIESDLSLKDEIDQTQKVPNFQPIPSNTKALSGSDGVQNVYALLVGCENYPGTANDLSYCADDAADIRNQLISKFGVPESNIQLLINSDGTESAITSALNTYSTVLDEDDVFVFSYSGHGTPSYSNAEYTHTISSSHPYTNSMDYY